MEKQKKHRVRMQYIFTGHYDIVAEDARQAREIADKDCGLIMGGSIRTSNDAQVQDWDFAMHPEKRIISTKQIK